MRIHIGRHSVEAIHESAKTLGAVDIAYALDSLEEQAALREAAWGAAELFVEVTLTPQLNERHTQLDLLLCFKDRAAIIEMKRRDLRGQELQRVRNQLAHQHKALGRRVRAAGWDEHCVVPVLFVPEAEASAIAELRIALDEAQDRHFVVAGIHRDSNFLATACITALAVRNVRPGPSDGHLAGVIRRCIKHELWKPSFESVAHARQALSAATSEFPQELPQDSWHLPALRSAELARGKEIIERIGVLEVVGPPGSGRSSFVRDLASVLNKRRYRELRDYPIRQTTRSEDVVRMLWTDLTGEDSSLGVDGLLCERTWKSGPSRTLKSRPPLSGAPPGPRPDTP